MATAFLFAAEYGLTTSITSLLRQYPPIIQSVNRQNYTALHFATEFGYTELIDLLVAAGANVLALDHRGWLPLHLALMSRHILVRYLEATTITHGGMMRDLVLCAVRRGLQSCVDEDFDSEDVNEWGKAGFLEAVLQENESLVKAFIVGGFNVDVHLKHDDYAPEIPTFTGLQIAVLELIPKMVSVLLEAGADPNVKNYSNGSTALHFAVVKHSTSIFETLLAARADVNMRNDVGQTPLHIAVDMEYLPLLCALLQRKPDLDVRDNQGRTALHLAVLAPTDEEVIRMLLETNANIFIPDDIGETPFDIVERSHRCDIAKIFANHLLSQSFFSVNQQMSTGSILTFKSPLSIFDHPGLGGALLSHVAEFYSLLDNFENAGFALGLDILNDNIIMLADPSDSPCFTGFLQICSELIYVCRAS